MLSAVEALCTLDRSSDPVRVNFSVPTGQLPVVVDDVRDEFRSGFEGHGMRRTPAFGVVVDDESVGADWISVRFC